MNSEIDAGTTALSNEDVELSERIREWGIVNFEEDVIVFADEVEQLKANNERLREALLRIANNHKDPKWIAAIALKKDEG